MPDTLPNLSQQLTTASSRFGVFILKRDNGKTVRAVSKPGSNALALFFLGAQTVEAVDLDAADWTLLGAIEDVPMSQGGQKPDEQEGQ